MVVGMSLVRSGLNEKGTIASRDGNIWGICLHPEVNMYTRSEAQYEVIKMLSDEEFDVRPYR